VSNYSSFNVRSHFFHQIERIEHFFDQARSNLHLTQTGSLEVTDQWILIQYILLMFSLMFMTAFRKVIRHSFPIDLLKINLIFLIPCLFRSFILFLLFISRWFRQLLTYHYWFGIFFMAFHNPSFYF
jgi:hypothetical protein